MIYKLWELSYAPIVETCFSPTCHVFSRLFTLNTLWCILNFALIYPNSNQILVEVELLHIFRNTLCVWNFQQNFYLKYKLFGLKVISCTISFYALLYVVIAHADWTDFAYS